MKLPWQVGDQHQLWNRKATFKFKIPFYWFLGDVMLAAAFASYIGAFGAAFRNRLWKETWLQDLIGRDIPLTPNVDPLWVLTSDSQAAVWQNEGN